MSLAEARVKNGGNKRFEDHRVGWGKTPPPLLIHVYMTQLSLFDFSLSACICSIIHTKIESFPQKMGPEFSLFCFSLSPSKMPHLKNVYNFMGNDNFIYVSG